MLTRRDHDPDAAEFILPEFVRTPRPLVEITKTYGVYNLHNGRLAAGEVAGE